MSRLKILAVKQLGAVQRSLALYMVRHLQNAEDSNLSKFSFALGETIECRIRADELHYVQQIESLREELSRSQRQIHYTDYGAGDPDANRTDVASYHGVKSAKRLSEVVSWSKPFFWGLLLLKLARQFRAKNCLELGSCVGISGSYIASAHQLAGEGALISMEGDPGLAQIAKENFSSLGLDNIRVVNGRFHDNLQKVLTNGMFFDFVFIDGHHDERATIEYFNMISSYLSEGAVVVFDDIGWSPGMKRAWSTLKKNERFSLTIDLSVVGICFFSKLEKERQNVKVPLAFVGAGNRRLITPSES